MIVGGISGGRIGDGRNFEEAGILSGGRSGGRQHTESKAGEANILRRGQRDINKLLFIDHDGLVVRRYPYSGRGVGWLWVGGGCSTCVRG